MNKFLWKFLLSKKQKRFFVLQTGLILIGALLSVCPIYFMERVINAAVYSTNQSLKIIIGYGGIYLLLQILRAFVIAITEFWAKQKQAEITYDLQIYTFEHISKIKLDQIKFSDTSGISTTLIEDTQYVGENAITAYSEFVTAIATFIFGVYFISKINPWLCLLIFPLALISSIVIKRLAEQSYENLNEQREKSTELWSTFEEGILGFLPLRLHNDIKNYFSKIKNKGANLKSVLERQARLESKIYFCTTSLFMITIGCIMILSSIFIVSGKITVGGLTSIMMYNNLLSEPMIKLQEIVKKIQKLNVSANRLQKLFSNIYTDENDKSDIVNEIILKNVCYQIKDRIILKDISLSIHPKSSLMIHGETGSGKTTLVNIITGVYSCTEGYLTYFHNGRKICCRPKVSYMLQDEYLFNDTIYENIYVGNRNVAKKDIDNIIEICKLSSVIRNHPEKIGENGKYLSGGERKRVLLARTIIDSTADIYVFDEMSASLDVDTYRELWESIEEFLNEKIRIYIEHSTIFYQKADCILYVDNGECIVEK